jgi:hypothetical protein
MPRKKKVPADYSVLTEGEQLELNKEAKELAAQADAAEIESAAEKIRRDRGAAPKDIELLSKAERDELLKDAAQHVLAERRRVAKEAFLKDAIANERRKLMPEEELVTFHINLAEFCPYLMVDGRIYYHGQTVTVPKAKADSMRDTIARGWEHQGEIEGKSRKTYRKQMEPVLSGKQVSL